MKHRGIIDIGDVGTDLESEPGKAELENSVDTLGGVKGSIRGRERKEGAVGRGPSSIWVRGRKVLPPKDLKT